MNQFAFHPRSHLHAAIVLGIFVFCSTSATQALAQSQSVYKCEEDGKVLYSDIPCPAAASGKILGSKQDSAEQKLATEKARAEVAKEAAATQKRLADREKAEANERAATMRTLAKSSGKSGSAEQAPAARRNARTKKPKTVKKLSKAQIVKPAPHDKIYLSQ